MAALTYSASEAAAVLGVSTSTIYRMVAAGEIPTRRLRGRIVIPKAALQRWLEAAA